MAKQRRSAKEERCIKKLKRDPKVDNAFAVCKAAQNKKKAKRKKK